VPIYLSLKNPKIFSTDIANKTIFPEGF